jgi:hypothetical protein
MFLPNVALIMLLVIKNSNCFNFHDFISLTAARKIALEEVHSSNTTSHNITAFNFTNDQSIIKLPTYANINKIPVIGILTSPKDGFNLTQVDANYIYWINSGGAEVIPISSNSTEAEIDLILTKVNGLVIPERYEPLINNTEPIVQYLIKKIIQINNDNAKTTLPCLGIGSGANLILATIANDFNIIDYIDASYNVMRNVKTVVSPTDINLLKHFDGRTYDSLLNNNATAHVIKEAVDPEKFLNNTALINAIKVTGISSNDIGKSYISMFEARDNIPIYGVLPHLEKIPWEKDIDIDRQLSYNSNSITISQKILNYFINQCRKNENTINTKTDTVELVDIKIHKPFKRNGRFYYYFGIDSNKTNINGLKFIQPENLKILENIPIENKILFSFKESGKDRNGNEIRERSNLRQTYISVSMKP